MFYSFSKKPNITDLQNNDTCDRYDYLTAVTCGVIAGMIDIFLVGAPGDSVIGNWTDAQVDNCVMTFARKNGWNPRAGNEENVKSAIGHLEREFQINYDHRHSGDVDNLFRMNTKNHHMKSLAHSPSPIGLFFSILNQFTSTATFLSNGQLINIQTETFELQGGNLISKLFCGIANWFGHLMSDVAGSSGATSRGSGIVMPFYELFGLCDFGSFNLNGDKQSLAQIATRAFENGYDARFGIALAIPVILCDLSTRLIWGIRRLFCYKYPLKDCIPTNKHSDLRVMLLCANGTLCLLDGTDALIRGCGNPVTVFMHLNLVGWCRLVTLVLKEIMIRAEVSKTIEAQIDAYKRMNEALEIYLYQLKQIDFDTFKREQQACEQFIDMLANTKTHEELNVALNQYISMLELDLPWDSHENFDAFIRDKHAIMRFT